MSEFRLAVLCAACAIVSLGSGGCRQNAPAATQTVVSALNASPKTSDFVIEATNSVRLQTGGMAVNGGDIASRGSGSGPFLGDGAAVDALTGVQVQTTHNVIADSVNLGTGAAVGDVQTNHLTSGTGATHGAVSGLVPLPAIPTAATVSPGTTAITVGTGATVSSTPGHFGAVSVGTGGTWKVAAGSYDISSLTMSSSAKLQALGAVQIHISGRLSTTSGAVIGPASGVTLTASGIRIEVSGINGTSGALTATPPAASFGTGNHVNALVLVPNGTLAFGTGAIATGAFMGRDVDVAGSGTQFVFQDGFPNAQTCTPQSCNDNNPCTVDTCNANGTCTHAPAMSGTSCSDGNACNGAETCDGAGACKAGTPVTCTAQDQCHAAGTCDPSTGACTNPAAANGTACNDGDACTRTDTCQAGVCTGGDTVACMAQDQCHVAGTCDRTTGLCSNPAKPDGTACNDGSACTRTDICQAGVCNGTNPVTCAAGDQCHGTGTCNPATGTCTNPALADGTPCNDGNACTRTDTCQAGSCQGANAVTCVAADQCHLAGTCDPTSGACTNPVAANGTACNDGNACTLTDACQGGSCLGTSPVTCAPPDQCHAAGTCDPKSGQCANAPALADGTTCNDGNACTTADTCHAGSCGGTAVTCSAPDQCHAGGTCDPGTGSCSNPTLVDGTPCNDGNACTTGEVCTSGTCGGGTTAACTGLALGTTVNYTFTTPEVGLNATTGSQTDVAPGEKPQITATVTDQGLYFYINGNLTAENGGGSTMTVGATSFRVEYFSSAQNQWVPVAAYNYTATGDVLPPTPSNSFGFADYNLFNVPGVTYTIIYPPETIIAPGATAGWFYSYYAILPPSDGIQIRQAARNGGQVRFVIELDSATDGSVSLAPVDLTATMASLPVYPLEVTSATAKLDNGPPVTLMPTGPIADGQVSAVFTGTVAVPPVTPRSSFGDDAAYLESLLSTSTIQHRIDVGTALNGTAVGLTTLNLPNAVPIVDFGLQPPPAVSPGQPTHYDLAFRNDGTGVAGPISLSYLLSGASTGTTSPPSQLAPAQSANGAIDFTAPANIPSGPLDDQIVLTWQDRAGNLYGPLTQTSGSCPIGACAALASAQTLTFAAGYAANQPGMSVTASTDVNQAIPGDTIHVTAVVTNTGLQIGQFTGLETVTNTGFAPFVVQGFRQTFEYFSTTENAWIPFLQHAVDSTGATISDPDVPDTGFWFSTPNTPDAPGVGYAGNIAGTTINPGATAQWYISGQQAELPPDVEQAIENAVTSGGVRAIFSFDAPGTVRPDPSIVDVTAGFAAPTAVDNIAVQAIPLLGSFVVSPLTSETTGPLLPGQTRTYTGSVVAPMVQLPDANSPTYDQDYLFALRNAALGGWAISIDARGTADALNPIAPETRVVMAGEMPILQPAKYGPSQATAGLPAEYKVFLQNIGTATGTVTSVMETANGAQLPATVLSMPPSIDPGQGGKVRFSSAAPLETPAGPFTDNAKISWTDRNGNVYGPLGASFTTNLLPGHPEGYLLLSAASVLPEQGSADLVTATAQDALGKPVPGVAVHVVVTGADPKTVDLLTGPDGTANFSYSATYLGKDSVVATGTVATVPVTASMDLTWVSSAGGAPCTGRGTPLDVVFVIDGSPSLLTDDNVAAAQAATDTFIDDINLSLDQVATITFSGGAELDVPFTTDAVAAKAGTDTAMYNWAHACDGFCGGGTNYPDAFQMALAQFQGPAHRDSAQPVVVFISDGGNNGGDYSAQLAALKAFGVRIISIGIGASVDTAAMRQIASSPNDYFYAPTTSELAWVYANVNQDTCSTSPPLVAAGGDQGAYEVRLPQSLTLQGEAHGNGPRGDLQLTATWSQVSGPAPVTFADASSPVTQALFTEPGTYVLQLEVSDGFLTTASQTTITVDPVQSLQSATLAIAAASGGPSTLGTSTAVTATLTDSLGQPISAFAVQFTVAGVNPATALTLTNAAGVATFTYAAANAGTDVVHATALGSASQLDSPTVAVQWVAPAGYGPITTQGWIGAPAQQATVKGLVPVTIAAGVTVASGSVSYWSTRSPNDVHVLTSNASGGPGATLATLDTTTLLNGAYVIDVNGIDSSGHAQQNAVIVTVAGDYKPGRVVVDVPEFTIPVAGIPIAIGRRYDSLTRGLVGDFGNGWSLTMGHPDLDVDPAHGVTITMPNGRRATFQFALAPVVANGGSIALVLGFLGRPTYLPAPGVFGSLTSDGCSILSFNPDAPDPVCFGAVDASDYQYSPMTYTYTDPYGTVYVMGSDGTLKSIQDRNQNTLTFSATGITSSVTGQTVAFTRDDQNRITKIVTPSLGDFFNTRFEYDYAYDASGNLATATRASIDGSANQYSYTYDATHRLLTTVDPLGHPARTSTYDDAGHLATDTDALGNVTKYAYDLAAHTTTTTYPDTGVVQQAFDDGGLLLSETDQLGRITRHEYDVDQNEVKRTNALGEVSTYTYDSNGNRTSSKNALGETTTTTYNAFSQPVTTTNPIGNTTSIVYDGSGLPTSFSDSAGPLATFTSSEHGLPTSITDEAGNVVFLAYDGAGNLTARTDRLGRQTTYAYDALGRQVTKTTPRGGVWQYGYDQRNEMNGVSDPINGIFGTRRFIHDNNGNLVADYFQFYGHGTNYTYDALNHQTQALYADGTVTSATRDFRGNKITETDEAGHVTSYTYDLAGQQTQTTYADGTSSGRTYDALGRLASATDERGNTTTYGYQPGCDCGGRITSVTDALGRTMSMTYDGMGRKTSTTDAAGHRTSFVYDLRGNLIETDYPDGTATHDTYDALGRRIASTDQTNATTHYGYDAEGQLTSVTDPLGQVTQYAYDGDGNLTTVTDGNGHVTSYAYDLMNEKLSRTLPRGMTESFTYDPVQELLTHTDFRGKTTSFTYDPRKRLQTKVPDPSLGEATITYNYNPDGTRASMLDASGTTTYTYDSRDRLLTKATPEGTLTYSYDPSGNLAHIASSNANGTSVGYVWDAANQLVSLTDDRLAGMTTAAYTATGQPSNFSQPNGVAVTYAYDSLDRVLSMAWNKGTDPAFAGWAYTYSTRGQRLSSTDLHGREAAYGYDVASRLTSETVTGDSNGATGNGEVTYAIDPAGNRSSRTSALAALSAQSFTYDANDQVTSDEYDSNGNTTASDGHTYAYDFENRLVSKDGGAVTIVYDGDGNRVRKTVGGIATQYLVDELNPTGYLQVMDEMSSGAVQVRYTYGNMLVSQTRGPMAAPATSFYGYDAHGDIAFLTDASGAVIDRYEYDAFGNQVESTGATLNTRFFAGEELDPDLGLLNLRARQYKPSAGRFMTSDPEMGAGPMPLSWNRYLYADADPVNLIDPLGRAAAAEYAAVLAVPAALLVPITVQLGFEKRHETFRAAAVFAFGAVVNCAFLYAADWVADEAMSIAGLPGDTALYAPPFEYCNHKRYECTTTCQSNGAPRGAYYVSRTSKKSCSDATQKVKASIPRGEYPRHCSCRDTEGFIGTGTQCE